MSFLNNLTHLLPFGKKEEEKEYFFALNIATEKLTAALWSIEGKELKILGVASESYSSNDEIVAVTDKLLDQVVGLKEIEPQKILFGVPHAWLSDENLKDDYLKILRSLVKELELAPMAYVATSHSLIHFLEKQEGVPTTAILVGFEKLHLSVTVVRAGKIDGVKVLKRGETAGADIEKALLAFADIETLPSKILIYGKEATEFKSQLLSFTWMSKLSFLHFPKIEVLADDVEIKSVCLAGGSEMEANISYTDQPVRKPTEKVVIPEQEEEELIESQAGGKASKSKKRHDLPSEDTELQEAVEEKEDFGFVVGDISAEEGKEEGNEITEEPVLDKEVAREYQEELVPAEKPPVEIEDFEPAEIESPSLRENYKFKFGKFIPKSFTSLVIVSGIVGVLIVLSGAYIFLPKADIKIFVEPKILEKDAQVVADPNQKTVDENNKIIPGQIVNVDVSGSAKDNSSGKRQIGDPAKGVVKVYNATDQQVTLNAGQTLTTDSGIKFKLDKAVPIASKSASAASSPPVSDPVGATAVSIGGDGNIPTKIELKVGNYSKADVVAISEGNFSGGTSKDVTVVSSEDQQRLLAKLSSDLRQQAQQKLQEKYPNKKILQEALSESISKKSYSKNINDQASEFSLNMTISYKGTAFDDADLRTIVSKLVNTQVPDGFQLDLSDTETQADVSKLEKDGKLIFLARFKAKLLPKIDTDKVRNQVKFKVPGEAANLLKGMDNVLGSEIQIKPSLPQPLQRLPFFGKNITVEVGLK